MAAGQLAVAVGAAGAGQEQAQALDTLSGVYSRAQAERGEAVYSFGCVRCHLADLSGNTGPSLKGERFLDSWTNESLYGLFRKIRDTMPPRVGNAVLSDSEKIDVVAYLLRVNGFPPGSEDLEIDEFRLASVEMVRPDGRTDVRNFALVQLVGCLTASPGPSWTLVRAGEPTVVTAATREVATAGAAGRLALGAGSYGLASVARFDPAAYSGHTVEVRGLLYRSPRENLLNVGSLRTVARSCSG